MRITGEVTEEDWAKAKTPVERLLVLRKYQISLGDLGAKSANGTVYEGYTFRKPPVGEMWDSLVDSLPTGELATDREIIRICAAFEVPSTPANRFLVALVVASPDYSVRIHALIALSRMPVAIRKADVEKLAKAILALDEKMARDGVVTDTNWPLRMKEMLQSLLVHQKSLAAVIEAHADYGEPGHLWIAQTPGISARASAEAFVRRSRMAKRYVWTAGQVGFLGELPGDEGRTILEKLFKGGIVDEAVVAVLSNRATHADVPIFKRYLGSLSATTVLACLHGLETVGATAEPKDWAKALKALRRFADPKTDAKVRAALIAWLELQTKQKHGDKIADWEAWLLKAHPDAVKELSGSAGYDAIKWKAKLAEVKWDAGDAVNGQKLFAKANCAACHNGGQASGPSLEGVAKRFNRDDLLTAILDPNRDVSPRYRTTRVTTVDDKTYEGIIIYEATDGIILQTTADATVRIAGKEIQSSKPGLISLMPTGLLDEFPPGDIADLLAYLKTLDAPKR